MTVPVTILTGFLGSGKTTLLNHALREPMLSRALVVVNELGAVPLDHLLVKEAREDVRILSSGCVCCSIRKDLVTTLLAFPDGEARFDRVFLETTGLADPAPLVATLVRHPELSQRYHLDAIVTVVDGEHALTTLAHHDEAKRQVILADDLIMTKLDIVSASTLQAVRTAAQALNPQARLFCAERGVLDWRPILECTPSTVASRFDITNFPSPHNGSEVHSFSVYADRAVDLRSCTLWLSMVSEIHGKTLLRMKGLLRVEDAPGPAVIQAVQHVVYPTYMMARWPSEDRSSRLTVITRGMPVTLIEDLRRSMDRLLNTPSVRTRASTTQLTGPSS